MDVDEGTSNQKEAQQEQQQEEESKGNHPEEHKGERDVDMHHSEQSQANQNAGDQQQELEELWKKLNDDVTQL